MTKIVNDSVPHDGNSSSISSSSIKFKTTPFLDASLAKSISIKHGFNTTKSKQFKMIATALLSVCAVLILQHHASEAVDSTSNSTILSNNTSVSTKDTNNSSSRLKRQYGYEDGYYGSYYGWQAGRLIGWILGFICLMLFICVPCICCIGIWFAGWFGLRQAMSNRRSADVFESRRGRYNRDRRYVEQPAALEVPTGERYIYAQASDRFYERRPRTPPPSTFNNATREGIRRAS